MTLFLIAFGIVSALIGGGSIILANRKRGLLSHPAGSQIHWNSKYLPLAVLSDDQSTEFDSVIKKACEKWNEATRRVYFVYFGFSFDTDSYVRPSPGMVVIRFVDNLDVRPHTQLLVSKDGEIRSSPILAPMGVSSEKLEQIIVHELGHTLGLPHSADSASVMYEKAIPSAKNITRDEILTLEALYPLKA